MNRAVHLLCSADVEPAVVELLPERLSGVLGCPVRRGGGFSLMPEDFHAGRRQYRASTVLRRLRPLRPAGACLLAVTGVDLFAAGRNFVFGEADVKGGCAIISLARLRAPYLGFALTTERLLRRALIEAVHEVGHLFGLEHCPQPTCVMYFSNSLADTDRKAPEPCPRCRLALPHGTGPGAGEEFEKEKR